MQLLTTVAKTLAILHRPEVGDTIEGLLFAKHVPSRNAPCRQQHEEGLAKNTIHIVEYGTLLSIHKRTHYTSV